MSTITASKRQYGGSAGDGDSTGDWSSGDANAATALTAARPDAGVGSAGLDSVSRIETAVKLLSETAHDIKSPLTGVRESLRLLSEGLLGQVNEMQYSTLVDAMGQCDNIQTLVDNMLHLDRLRSGVPACRRQWISPADLKRSAESVLQSIAGPRRIEIVWQGFDEGAKKVFGDQQLLRRLLVNLVGNAIAISDERGRVMIALRPSINRGFGRLTVSDHGPGLSADNLARLARRGQSGTGGTGLGLAISMALAALHYGRLFVSSQPGTGSRIGLELPSAGPASVADAFARWREMMAPARGLLSSHEKASPAKVGLERRSRSDDGSYRVDTAEPLKPGLFKNEMQLSFEGRSTRFPFHVISSGLRLDAKVANDACDAIDDILQTDQRLHELVYRTDSRRWVFYWDVSEEEARRRLSDLDRKIRDQIGIQGLDWQTVSIQKVAHRGDRAKIREGLVRDMLQASKRAPLFEDVFSKSVDSELNDQMDQTMARRLEQELRFLNKTLRRQSNQLAQQAAELDRLMD